MDFFIDKYATHLLGVSKEAAIGLFGSKVLSDPRYRILTSGIDLKPFGQRNYENEIRKKLTISEKTKVVGHVGRFSEAKNQMLFIEVASEICRRRQDISFLMIGDGPLRSEIESKIKTMGLKDRFVLTGMRSDVPILMENAIDVLLFPSKWEGSPRTLIEAQAAGLPCVISSTITEQADLVKPLIQRVSLTQPIAAWVKKVLASFTPPPQ